jgi:hypothetical protein
LDKNQGLKNSEVNQVDTSRSTHGTTAEKDLQAADEISHSRVHPRREQTKDLDRSQDDGPLAANPASPLPSPFTVGRGEGVTVNTSQVEKRTQLNLSPADKLSLHAEEQRPSRCYGNQEVEIHTTLQKKGRSTTLPATVDQNEKDGASNIGEMPAIGVSNHCGSQAEGGEAPQPQLAI